MPVEPSRPSLEPRRSGTALGVDTSEAFADALLSFSAFSTNRLELGIELLTSMQKWSDLSSSVAHPLRIAPNHHMHMRRVRRGTRRVFFFTPPRACKQSRTASMTNLLLPCHSPATTTTTMPPPAATTTTTTTHFYFYTTTAAHHHHHHHHHHHFCLLFLPQVVFLTRVRASLIIVAITHAIKTRTNPHHQSIGTDRIITTNCLTTNGLLARTEARPNCPKLCSLAHVASF